MRKLLVFVFFLFSLVVANSQNLTVEGTAPDLYITHTVAPKENFYSIGRLYNQAPKSIAAFNNLVMEKGLTIGQRVKVPLNTQNLDVSGKSASGEMMIPLTHIVAKSETLFKIGTDHNVSAQSLKEWNNLASDNIAPGTPLIVGHLKVGSSQAVAANTASTSTPATTTATTATPAPVVNTPTPPVNTTPVVTTEAPAAKVESATAVKPSVDNSPKKEELFESVKPVNKKEESVAATKADVGGASNTNTKGSSTKEELFESVKPVEKKEEPVVGSTVNVASVQKDNPSVVSPSQNESIANAPVESKSDKIKNNNKRQTDISTSSYGSIEGAFAANFAANKTGRSLSNLSGEAATFKSTSGWQDKRYYVLINDVAPGTIVKIASSDNKTVYAKVLGGMPEMKENNGLLLRMSNAAASYLGIIDPKFPVQVTY